jgi:PAP2 superfamily
MTFVCPPEWRQRPPLICDTYDLRGPQVEPAASYWTECRPPCVVTISDLQAQGFALPPYPIYPGPADDEIEELIELSSLRDDPEAIVSNLPNRRRRRISPFLQLRPQPLGAIINLDRERSCGCCNGRSLDSMRCQCQCHSRRQDRCVGQPEDNETPVIRTGRELARYFESETPGIAHRLALNYLLSTTNWSPPRQAFVWMALDVAIYSALGAAWYFKWRDPDVSVSRRPRPIECDYRVSVLYNLAVDCDGNGDGERRTLPDPSPGTPRHPAYPSGHSTYAAAASEILSYFFPDFTGEFDDLADNAGLARLWAGIHWRSDHTAGQLLGRFIAQLLIKQIENGCVTAPPDPCEPTDPCPMIPTIPELDACANACCRTDKSSGESEATGYNAEKKVTARGDKEATGATRNRRSRREQSSAASDEGGRGRRGGGQGSSSANTEQARGPQRGASPTGSRRDETSRARGPQEGAGGGGSETAAQESARGPQEGAG